MNKDIEVYELNQTLKKDMESIKCYLLRQNLIKDVKPYVYVRNNVKRKVTFQKFDYDMQTETKETVLNKTPFCSFKFKYNEQKTNTNFIKEFMFNEFKNDVKTGITENIIKHDVKIIGYTPVKTPIYSDDSYIVSDISQTIIIAYVEKEIKS